MYFKKYFLYIFLFGYVSIVSTSCKKWITIDPPADQIIGSEVFKDDATARAAISGIYAEMMNSRDQFTTHGVSL